MPSLRHAIIAASLAIAGALGLVVPSWTTTAPIAVEVAGLRSNEGMVLGAIFASARGWTEEGREIATCRASIARQHATCVIDGLPPGTYAFAFLHDEDLDGHMDRDWIGIPQEGYGFSNDAAPGLGPPSFESASFAHGESETVLHVHARYGI